MDHDHDPAPSDEKLDFDDDTLRAIAEVYKNEGNDEYRKKKCSNAIHFYTEGLQVNCKDDKLNAKLYSNRAKVYFYLGNYEETLNNATAAVQLEPTYIKAIERGANACFRLQRYEEAISWCEKGLAIDKSNKNILDLRARSSSNLQEIKQNVRHNTGEGTWNGEVANAYDSLADLKNTTRRGLYLRDLGIVYHNQGNFRKAMEYFESHLKIAQEVGDKAGEGDAYGNLGSVYYSLGDFKKAMECYERDLKIAEEVGNRAEKGRAYGSLGNAYHSLGVFEKAIEYHERRLKIAQEVGHKVGEGRAYGNLGSDFQALGDFKKAIEYHERCLKICQEVGDKAGEGRAYGNLGNAYLSLDDFQKAIEYYELDLKIAEEVGDRVGKGHAYGNLGNAYKGLGDLKKAIEYFERHLKIAKEVGDKAGEGIAYGNLGSAYHSLGDFKKAFEYYEHGLKIAKEVGDRVGEAHWLYNLGKSFELTGSPLEALDCCRFSVKMFNNVRHSLLLKDEWKISFRHLCERAYTSVWRLLLKQGETIEALFTAEQGRAQALQDLMISKYATETARKTEEATFDTFSCLPSNTVFMAFEEREVIFWIIQNGNVAQLNRKELGDDSLEDVATSVAQSLINSAFEKIGVRSGVKCEDRSLDRIGDEDLSKDRSPPTMSQQSPSDTNPLRKLYDVIIGPILDVIDGNELVFVPEGPLCLAPYAAFVDSDSKYLCEAFKIRVIPSLTSLKLITDCPADYHSKTGALLVGDPCLENVLYQGRKLVQLPGAKTEVEMIGKILHLAPLTGRQATKDEVLKRLSSVALVHIAAHGSMETGEIALAPKTTRDSQKPTKEIEDYMLTMKDVLNVQLRARLVVLSCCHSGRGEIKAEGVVGIARAFLGAGARSVLVYLWAIDDEATLEFMKSFYRHLAERRSASEALNRAMKCMRESEEFNEVKYWAPFVLIGDDVTLDYGEAVRCTLAS